MLFSGSDSYTLLFFSVLSAIKLIYFGWTENAGPENGGPENGGPEIAGPGT